MQDIGTFMSSLHIVDETPETTETWEQYYIANVQGNENGVGTTPENIDLNSPISQRYEQIRLFRILGYKKEFRRSITKMFFDLETICRSYLFPLFFVLDFEEYQKKRRWMIDGKEIKNIKGAFYRFSLAKRERMRASGAWRGHEMENYKFCGSCEL